jgi:predicted amidohydrolase YtcJ
MSPLLGVQSAVSRYGFALAERITVREALSLYTINAAYACFEEKTRGSIEVGKLADLVVLSHDPFATPPNRIRDIKVDMTLADGKIAYTRDASSNPES